MNIKKIILLFLLTFGICAYADEDWEFHSSSLEGDRFYLNSDSIEKYDGHVYFWYLKSYLMPNKFGDMSAKVYAQGDCIKNRLKYLSYIWYQQPMGNGIGEQSNEASEWEFPTSESVGIDLLNDACNN